MYFALIQEQLAAGASLPDATARVARRLREAFPLSSLNAILLDSEQLVVVHASARSVLPADDFEEITQLGGLPDEHNEDYFALRWKRAADSTVLDQLHGCGRDRLGDAAPRVCDDGAAGRRHDAHRGARRPAHRGPRPAARVRHRDRLNGMADDDALSDLVAASLPTLSRAGRQVGRVLLADYPSAGLSTLADLAARAGSARRPCSASRRASASAASPSSSAHCGTS